MQNPIECRAISARRRSVALALALATLALPLTASQAVADSASNIAKALGRVIGGGESTSNPVGDVSKYIGHYEQASPSAGPAAPAASALPMATGFVPGQTIFTDAFKTFDPDWGQADDTSSVADGQFRFHAAAGQSATRYSSKYRLPEADLTVGVAAAEDSAADSDAGLLIWGSATETAYTAFEIKPALGVFAVTSIKAGKQLAIIPWQHDPAINTAPGAVNQLRVVAGLRAIFLINGHPVAQLTPPHDLPDDGQIGLFSDGGSKDPSDVAFSDLVVKMSPDAPSFGVAAAPTATAGQVLWSSDFQNLDPSWGYASASFNATAGKLHVDSSWPLSALSDKFSYGPIDLSADVSATGQGQGSGGLAFWGNDATNLTEFGIAAASGTFVVHHVDYGRTIDLIRPQASPAINTAAGASNHLEVKEQHGQAVLLINGQQVGTVPEFPKSGGLVGIWDDPTRNEVALDFSNFRVVAATASPASESTTTTTLASAPATSAVLPPAAPVPAPPAAAADPVIAPVAASSAPAAVSSSSVPEATIAALAPSSPKGFTDDFASFDPAWGESGKYIYVANNVMELHSGTNLEIDLFNAAHPLPQGEAEVSLLLEDGTADDALGGLDFWGRDDENYTLFAVDPTKGDFALFSDTAGKSAQLIDWTHSDLIQTGVGKSNRLGVRLNSDKAILLINGQQVGEFATPADGPGDLIGLDSAGGVNGPGHFGFAHLVVTSGAPASSPATNPGAGTESASSIEPAGKETAPPAPSSASAPAASSASQPVETTLTPTGTPTPPAVSTTQPDSAPASAPSALELASSAAPAPQAGAPEGGPPTTPFAANAAASGPANVPDTPPPAAREPGPNEQLVLADDFSDLTPAWGKADQQVFAENGHLVAQVPGKGFAQRLNGVYRYYAADISFAGRVADGPPQSGVETAFWFQDNQHYDYLYVSAVGTFAIYNLSGTTVTAVVPEQASPAIHAGLSQWNSIELSLGTNAGTLSINGTSVAQFAGTPPSGWAFGLIGNGAGPGPSTIQFANLRVAVPTPLKLTRGWTEILSTPPQVAAPGASLVDDFQSFSPNWDMPAGLLTVAQNALSATASSGLAAGTINKQYRFGSADISVSAELAETAQTDTFATLLFWANDDLSDSYQLSVSSRGYYRLMHHAGTQNIDVTGWQGTAAIRQGVGQVNSFGVSLTATGGTIVVNDRPVSQFSATPPQDGGFVGLSMESSKAGTSTWNFSKLRVSERSSQ